jgi:hypothetical protein
VTQEQVLARVESVSFIAALPAVDNRRVVAQVAAVLAQDPETRDKTQFDFPYRTDVFVTTTT